jgi:uncharacterized membrane protein
MPYDLAAFLALHILPLSFGLFLLLLPLIFFYMFFRLQESSFERLGISHRMAFLVIALSLFLSVVNIPVHTLGPHNPTTIAINAGGALIPMLVSGYLILTRRVPWIRGTIATLIVAVLVYDTSQMVPGLGIVTPIYVPPLAAAVVAINLTKRDQEYAPTLAYVSGTMGTLIGADLMNLPRIADLGVGMASIGGAGQFDGIYLTGIIAALLA